MLKISNTVRFNTNIKDPKIWKGLKNYKSRILSFEKYIQFSSFGSLGGGSVDTWEEVLCKPFLFLEGPSPLKIVSISKIYIKASNNCDCRDPQPRATIMIIKTADLHLALSYYNNLSTHFSLSSPRVASLEVSIYCLNMD